jgi:hypothetical protein
MSYNDHVSRIECQGCGYVLEVPPTVGEGGQFVCANCRLIMLDVRAAREFRWSHVDAYTRKHGASRANRWGGFIGSVIWLPIFASVAAVKGEFRPQMMLALAIPYLGLLALLFRERAQTPAAVWLLHLWIGLGAYGVYLWLLFTMIPDWWRVFDVVGGNPPPPLVLGIAGLGFIVFGVFGTLRYRRKAARLPQAQGVPPAP